MRGWQALVAAVLLAPLGCRAESTPSRQKHAAVSPPEEAARSTGCLADEIEARPHGTSPSPHQSCIGGEMEACERACEDGDADSCVYMGYRLERERASREPAGSYYARGCRLGTMNGCTNYAALLVRFGGEEDAACAVRIFETTCAAGDPHGCGMQALQLARGHGTEAAPERALNLARRKCDEVGHFACSVLGAFHEQGLTGAPDVQAAVLAYQRACRSGLKNACGEVERLRRRDTP